jgi:TonB family protein
MPDKENHGIEKQVKPVAGSWISLGAHGALLVLLIVAGRHAWKVRPVSSRGGAHATILYWQGGVGTGAVKMQHPGKVIISPRKKTAQTNPLQKQKQQPLNQTQAQKDTEPQASSAGSSTSPSQMSGAGTGMQDATPAFPTFSPNPPVRDRSLLPNSETNVVVDVNVSAQGEVLDEKLIRGLGNSIDQAILDTVRSWKFHPATVDGNPVSSVSELVFPMSQRYRG